MERPVEGPGKDQLRTNTLREWGAVLQVAAYILNHRPLPRALSPIGRIHGSRNQGMKTGVVSLLPSRQEASVLPVPTVLGPAGLEVLLPKGATVPQGETR